jgi:flagellar hook-basal body complex protein FliE
MDPISSLQFAVSPEMRAGRLSKLAGDAAGQAIPSVEIEKLTGANGPAAPATGPSASTFEGTLGKLVSDVNGQQVAADQAVNGLLSGGNVSLHQAMIAMEEANVSFQLMIEVRNKLLDSYQELMRMQV